MNAATQDPNRVPKNARRRGWKARRRQIAREAAEKRQAAYDALTPAQRLKKLEDGGHGHCKEAEKYREAIAVNSLTRNDEVRQKTRKMRKRDRKAKK